MRRLKVLISTCCCGLLSLEPVAAIALRTREIQGPRDVEQYSFVQFSHDYGRELKPGSDEYTYRAGLFKQSLLEIAAQNAKNTKEGRLWRAGVHPFMDWTKAERAVLHGYKPGRVRGKTGVSFLHAGSSSDKAALNSTDFFDDVGVDYDSGPRMRNQGNCGSCWAISAVEAVEAHMKRSGVGNGQLLSAQALIDCVPNPHHCGGTGGCDGATGELAFAYMRDYGIPMETEMPYEAKTGQCSGSGLPVRARVGGWMAVPSNRFEPLKQALVSQGPAVVSVDANSWFNYESGIFDGCEKDAILGHAVLAKGFGNEGGNRYWLIQNSWGSNWGERGHIRIQMHDDEENWCGIDNKPSEGNGCDGGPPEVRVCGSCGILYDAIIPTDVRLDGAEPIPIEKPRKAAFNQDEDAWDQGQTAQDTTSYAEELQRALQ